MIETGVARKIDVQKASRVVSGFDFGEPAAFRVGEKLAFRDFRIFRFG